MAAGANGRPGYSNPNPQYASAVRDLASNLPPQGGLLNVDPTMPPQGPAAPGLLTPDVQTPASNSIASLLAPGAAPNGYADLPAGPLPAPQTVDPQVYTDKAIAVNGPLMTPPKGPPQAVPPQMPAPQAAPPQAPQPPDSAAPLAASINTNQQALADALTRLRAAQQQAGGYPSSLFRRAGNPMGAYQ